MEEMRKCQGSSVGKAHGVSPTGGLWKQNILQSHPTEGPEKTNVLSITSHLRLVVTHSWGLSSPQCLPASHLVQTNCAPVNKQSSSISRCRCLRKKPRRPTPSTTKAKIIWGMNPINLSVDFMLQVDSVLSNFSASVPILIVS